MAELKPCPFCGGVATQLYSAVLDTYIYGCYTSLCMGNAQNHVYRFETDREAIEAWNGRADKRLKIIEVNPSFREAVEANDGYCPCMIEKSPDTKCMCKDFREQTEPGKCHCGRFEKVGESDEND